MAALETIRIRVVQTPPYPLLTASQVADALGISLDQVAKLRARRQFVPAVKIGTSVRWRPEDVDAWIESRRETTDHR